MYDIALGTKLYLDELGVNYVYSEIRGMEITHKFDIKVSTGISLEVKATGKKRKLDAIKETVEKKIDALTFLPPPHMDVVPGMGRVPTIVDAPPAVCYPVPLDEIPPIPGTEELCIRY